MPSVRRLILVLMTRRSREFIILNCWVLPLMLNSLGLNTLVRYARLKKASSAIGALKHVRPFIPTDAAVQFYNALISYHILIIAARFGIV